MKRFTQLIFILIHVDSDFIHNISDLQVKYKHVLEQDTMTKPINAVLE